MDYDPYISELLVEQRLAALRAQAERDRLIRAARGSRRSLRIALGTVLIRVGAWLARGDESARVPAQ